MRSEDMTQDQELLQLLKDRGSMGVNSFEPFRNNHRQLPRMIDDLEKAGNIIEHNQQKNTSTTYVLMGSRIKNQPRWIFGKDGIAREPKAPEQQSFI